MKATDHRAKYAQLSDTWKIPHIYLKPFIHYSVIKGQLKISGFSLTTVGKLWNSKNWIFKDWIASQELAPLSCRNCTYLLVLFNLGHLWSCPIKAYCITQHTTIKISTKNGMERDWMIPWQISVTELFASNGDKHTGNADSNLENLKQLPDDKISDKQGLTDSHQVFGRLTLCYIAQRHHLVQIQVRK